MAERERDREIVLRTYGTTWKFAKQIYAIDRFRLPVPVKPGDLGYFVIGLLVTFALLKVFPFLNAIPAVIRYLLIPFGLMKFLTKKKFDGKLPHKFLLGYLEYMGLPKTIVRFQAGETFKPGKFTNVVYRGKEIIDITKKSMATKHRGRQL